MKIDFVVARKELLQDLIKKQQQNRGEIIASIHRHEFERGHIISFLSLCHLATHFIHLCLTSITSMSHFWQTEWASDGTYTGAMHFQETYSMLPQLIQQFLGVYERMIVAFFLSQKMVTLSSFQQLCCHLALDQALPAWHIKNDHQKLTQRSNILFALSH